MIELISQMVIIGAGGHSKVVADVAIANMVTILGFLDDSAPDAPLPQYRLLGTVGEVDKVISGNPDAELFIAIGDNRSRWQVDTTWLKGRKIGGPLIHPFGFSSPSAGYGIGTVVMPGVVVNSGAAIGRHVILNTCCSVDHDCTIGDYAHVSPGAHLAGGVTIGEGCHIGTGASVIPGVNIGGWAVIGAGAVVTEDIPARAVAVGVPARVIKMVGQ